MIRILEDTPQGALHQGTIALSGSQSLVVRYLTHDHQALLEAPAFRPGRKRRLPCKGNRFDL